jgi:hypothetical protein
MTGKKKSRKERLPSTFLAPLGRGFTMLTTGQYDRALVAFNQVIPRMTDDHAARVLRARAFLGRNDMSDP